MMIEKRDNCRGCSGKNLTLVFDLGEMPLAGGFITKEEIPFEKKFPLRIYFCGDCGLMQGLDAIDPEILFENYFYESSAIPSLVEHFRRYADFLKRMYLKKSGSKILEFGCNDGILLQNFKDDPDITAVGIDPSKNITEIARKKGLKVITDYFNQRTAKKIAGEYGQMDVVTGSNVFAHIDDIHETIKAAKIAMKPGGVFVVEVHYLGSILDNLEYDAIYHEHLSYYSVTALRNILELEGLKITDAEYLPVHGGSIRVTAGRKEDEIKIQPSVAPFLAEEKNKKMDSAEPFFALRKRAERHKKEVLALLRTLKNQDKRIVGYGAPGRGAIFLNYCGIDLSILEYIVDISPLRIGRVMPGVHIPIFHPDKARKNPPDYFFVIAWTYLDSIMKQESGLAKKGVKFIMPFPEVKII